MEGVKAARMLYGIYVPSFMYSQFVLFWCVGALRSWPAQDRERGKSGAGQVLGGGSGHCASGLGYWGRQYFLDGCLIFFISL